MKKKNMYPYIAAILLCMGCSKDPQIERVYFEFEIPFTVTPGNDTVRVGDTLRMEAEFSDSLYDALSNSKYYMDCFPLPAFMAVRALIDPFKGYTFQRSAIDSFAFLINPDFGGITGSTYANVNLKCVNHYYKFSMQFVPRRRGVYSILLADFNSDQIILPDKFAPSTTGKKRIPVVRYNRYIINEGKTHFNIYKQHAQQALPDGNWPLLEEYGTYTFVVK